MKDMLGEAAIETGQDATTILNTMSQGGNYTMDEIAGYITGIAFKLSNIKASTLKSSKLDGDLTELIELVVDEIYKLNEIIRSLNSDSAK